MRIPAIRIKQWLDEWDRFEFDDSLLQRKPKPHFYVCSMSAPLLRRLSGVRRREAEGPRAEDLGIQRGHDASRSVKISRFIKAGYPWASLNTHQQKRFPNLRKPGWLPTAIVANLVSETTERFGMTVDPHDLITIEQGEGQMAHLVLPEGSSTASWSPKHNCLDPIEIN